MIYGVSIRPRERRHPGLTVVELLVATALATMLMVGILGLTTTLNLQCRELMQGTQPQPWGQLLCEQLRRDMHNARHLTIADNRVILTGYLGTRGNDHHGTLRAAEVTYHIATAGDHPCLLRDERSLDVDSTAVSSRQLVATGVSRVQFLMPGSSQPDDSYAGAIPRACRVRFLDSSSTGPLVEVLWCQ